MKRLLFLFVIAGIGLIVSSGLAQQRGPRGGGFGMLGLLSQESVQKELKLSEDQITKVKALAEKQRGGGRDPNASKEDRKKKMEERAKENAKALGEILKPEQLKRVKQISWQRGVALAFRDEEVASALKFTDEQKEKLKGIQEASMKEMRELFQGGGEEARKKMTEMRKQTEEKVLGLLSTEQKAKWKELTGEPFTGEIRRRDRKQ